MLGEEPKVPIANASNLICGLTWGNLGHKYEFSSLNRRAVPEILNTQADIPDFDTILLAFKVWPWSYSLQTTPAVPILWTSPSRTES